MYQENLIFPEDYPVEGIQFLKVLVRFGVALRKMPVIEHPGDPCVAECKISLVILAAMKVSVTLMHDLVFYLFQFL